MAILVLGTGNLKKRGELEELLDLPELELRTLRDFDNVPEIVEDGDTFIANAIKKARVLAEHLGHWVLGEDSGLAVDALNGAPGIYSARYAGEPCDDEANNDKLLEKLRDVPEGKRTAQYVCTIAIADPTGEIHAQSQGFCRGRMGWVRQGTNGFGYDPLFLFGDGDKSFGQLSASFKCQHSHRAEAVRLLRPQLQKLLESGVM